MAKKKRRNDEGQPSPAARSAERAQDPSPPSADTATKPPIAAAVEIAAASQSSRALSNAFIACFLLFMLAMPLRYYLGGRGFDERFSWRMFSTIRMLDCTARVDDVYADGRSRPVPLGQEVQIAWIGMLERARGLVVKKLLQRRCGEQPDLVLARYHLACTSTDKTKLPDVDKHMLCARGEVEEGRGEP